MIAYLDCPSGISGDIFLGCLVDAGWPIARLAAAIAALGLDPDEWSVHAQTVMKGPMRATLVNVAAEVGHHERRLADIDKMIRTAALPRPVQDSALAAFTRLADAEAKVHGTTRDQIHFHEVGAVDAIIDIVGVCMGLHDLAIDKLYASALPVGPGWANTQHGQIPLPAPATLELLAAAKAPVRPAPGPGELVTPTGAALVAALATFGQPALTLERIGTGAGQKNFAWPNIARLWLGTAPAAGPMVQLETNIDDMNPQLFAAVSDKLFAAGAKDVWFTPIQMKKNRPAIMLSALAPAAAEPVLTDVILRETTTLGVRVHQLDARREAAREFATVATPYGDIRIKLKLLDNQPIGATPEFDDCRALAEKHNVPVKQVLDAATAAAQKLLPP